MYTEDLHEQDEHNGPSQTNQHRQPPVALQKRITTLCSKNIRSIVKKTVVSIKLPDTNCRKPRLVEVTLKIQINAFKAAESLGAVTL